MGRTGDDLCTVSALLDYLQVRGSKSGPLFHCAPLSKSKSVKSVRAALTRAGLPALDYAGHSLQIGAGTTAATAGVEESTIQTLGRWQSSSYFLYIRLKPGHLAAILPNLTSKS